MYLLLYFNLVDINRRGYHENSKDLQGTTIGSAPIDVRGNPRVFEKYIISNCILIKWTNAYILPVSEMAVLLYVVVFSLTCLLGLTVGAELESCHGAGLKYLNGDALSGMAPCLGPDNTPYPT